MIDWYILSDVNYKVFSYPEGVEPPVVTIPVTITTIILTDPATAATITNPIIPTAAPVPIIPTITLIITASIIAANAAYALSKRTDELEEGVHYFYYD